MDVSNNLDQLMIARRLIMHAQRLDDKRKGKKVEEKSAKDEMEEDSALLSGQAPVDASTDKKSQIPVENTQVSLADLVASLRANNGQAATGTTTQVQINYQQTIEREATLVFSGLEKVDGLVRRSQTLAETDRYRFDFTDGATFKITDKWNNRSTTIWGDPHVDVDDVEGNRDGEFSDLKGSNSQTTLMLKDGTRVTFTARDDSVIEAVDIFKDGQHLGGVGAASKDWNEKNALFADKVDESGGKAASLATGDTVYAGGDGNDWYTADGKLLWGKTTGPAVNTRPPSTLRLEYRETVSTQLSVQVVNKQA